MNELQKLEYWLTRGLIIENDESYWEFGFQVDGEWEIMASGDFCSCVNQLPEPNSLRFKNLPINMDFSWNNQIWTKISASHARREDLTWPMDKNIWLEPVLKN